MKKVTCNLILVLFFSSLAVHAGGDPQAGKQKSATLCSACHGPDGNSINPAWPSLAGQNERYLLSQMRTFKEGNKGFRKSANSVQMYAMVAGLSEQDMQDLAAYYSAQLPKTGVAQDELAIKGQAIYRGGNMSTGLPACIACHGPAGEGNEAAGFPAVAGQHAQYSYEQLKAFHADERSNIKMNELIRRMSDEEMRAVAQYMQGLYAGE